MKNSALNITRIIVVAIAALIVLPWGGLTHFNTKGEPREAIVATSMLESGNWILPESYGHDIPYKPPMLAWCVAAVATATGGTVSEYASRLPSELAAIALVLMTFNWVARRRDSVTAALTALVTLTAFEVMRNAVICRVDMLLTFFIVGALYLLDDEGVPRRRVKWRVLGAIVLMSCATLTKGPVGALLPCLVAGVYRLVTGRKFFPTLLKLTGMALAAMVLPAAWYYAAWLQGGQEFLDLALEENIGRLTGTMSYDSHLNPWWYNLVCVLWGMAPYTLLALMGLWPVVRSRKNPTLRRERVGKDAVMAMCAAVLIIGFYCIPASKRSVYLLPAYPFMAFGVVAMSTRLAKVRSSIPRIYAAFIGWLGVVAALAVVALRLGVADGVGGSAGRYISYVAHGDMEWWGWILVALPAVVWLVVWKAIPDLMPLAKSVACLAAIYIMYLGCLQPMILNPRSNISDAAKIEEMQPEGEIYSYLDDKYMRYFTVNYYLGDRLRMMEKTERPRRGALLLMNPALRQRLDSLRPGLELADRGMRFVSCDRRRDTVAVYTIGERQGLEEL